MRAGAIGEIYAADLVFHNSYGPDRRWYYDPLSSGGGCVIDLGIHFVDLALWILEFATVERVSSRLFAQGKALKRKSHSRRLRRRKTRFLRRRHGESGLLVATFRGTRRCHSNGFLRHPRRIGIAQHRRFVLRLSRREVCRDRERNHRRAAGRLGRRRDSELAAASERKSALRCGN